jgi:membrane-associated phospholipid phosphatase
MSLIAAGLNDAMLAAWDSKYAYNRPRPSQVDETITTLIDVPQTPSYPSEHAAAAGVASTVLAFLFPDDAEKLKAMGADAMQSRYYTGTEFLSDVSAGMTLGVAVASAVTQWAQTDGSDAVFNGTFPPGPAKWSSASPSFPLAGTWRTWALRSGSAVRLAAPPAAGTQEFMDGVNAVKTLQRTAGTNHTAWFWQPSFIDPWIDTINRLLFENRLDRDFVTSAGVYALGLIAQHDATIACWDTKYAYLEQRPVQADPQIQTLFATPQHPSYPSGHACAGGAMAGVLAAVFPEHAAEFADEAKQAGLSTFYAGIHYPRDVDAGLKLGSDVAAAVVARTASDKDETKEAK